MCCCPEGLYGMGLLRKIGKRARFCDEIVSIAIAYLGPALFEIGEACCVGAGIVSGVQSEAVDA
jgi:hypothetical protein